MRQRTGSALVQLMACRLFGAKPLPKPMLTYCQLDSWEQISVKFESEFYHFHSRKCIWYCRLPKWRPFCPGGDELKWGVLCAETSSRVTLYTAGHLHTAVPHCSHSRAPIVHTAVPRENNEHGCVYLRCRAVCKLPGCVEGHPWSSTTIVILFADKYMCCICTYITKLSFW